jgi:hypothetical protein
VKGSHPDAAPIDTPAQALASRRNHLARGGHRHADLRRHGQHLRPDFNEDPADDPGGPGTAIGNRIEVLGLTPLPESPEGVFAELEFPMMEVDGPEGLEMHLREDFVDAALGMPSDLNGDLVIDEQDHSEDYLVLPVRITVRWMGSGDVARKVELCTLMVEYTEE